MARVLFIPDLHCYHDHPKALEFLKRVSDQWLPDRIVCAGDEIDAHSFSIKWHPNPDLVGPSQELELSIESLQRYYTAFPVVNVLQSNHGMRIFKKCIASGLPSLVLRRYEEILNYPKGWSLVGDHVDIDGVHYIHGEPFNNSSWVHASNRLRTSVAMGHLHSRGGVVYSQGKKRRFFSANFGCLVNTRSIAFDYAKHSIEKPTLGCGMVIDGEEAYFIPMPEKLASKC